MRAILGFISLMALAACAAATNPPGQANQPPSATPSPVAAAQPSPSAAVTLEEKMRAAVKSGFGPQIDLVTGNEPFYLVGDFNGDGREDLAVSVNTEQGRGDLKKHGVKFLDVSPFADTNGSEIDVAEMGRNCVGVAIIHGGDEGWAAPQANAKYLFYECFIPFSLVRKGSRVERGTASRGPTPKLKGDAILLELESGGSTLVYWDGKTYRGFAIREGD